jgi:RimJ/RimL family protein N-acetyltransferase
MDHAKFLDHPHSRIMLCVPYQKDARLLMQWINDPETRQYLMRYAPVMLAGEEKWLQEMGVRTASLHPVENAMLLIVEKTNHKRIGTIGLHHIDWKNRNATTGTLIGNKDYLGRGFGTDAKMLMLNWAFNELGLNKVLSRVIAFNERSLAYGKKCGYQEVGRLKRHIFRDGDWHDEVILEVHNEDWQKLWIKFEHGEFRKKSIPQQFPGHSAAMGLHG